jgi:hypothetical protein
LAKLLTRKIQIHLPTIIRLNQTGFVTGCNILDKNFLAQEYLDQTIESNQQLILLLLDFEKTFDYIEWGFLFKVLKKLGFSITWTKWVSTFYWMASSKIKVSDEIGNPFHFSTSVCQGYPLVSYLFILATNVFGHTFNNPCYDVKGFTFPKGKVL